MTREPWTRVFTDRQVMSGKVDFAGYPGRYLIVQPASSWGGGGIMRLDDSPVDYLFTALEYLEELGWELVTVLPPSWQQGSNYQPSWVMRRTHVPEVDTY